MESDIIIKELKDHLNSHLNNKVIEVILFGSTVKGSWRNGSTDFQVPREGWKFRYIFFYSTLNAGRRK